MAEAGWNKEAKQLCLVLTEKEAETLYGILYKVGGCPYTSRRRLSDNIYEAIQNLNVLRTHCNDMRGGIHIDSTSRAPDETTYENPTSGTSTFRESLWNVVLSRTYQESTPLEEYQWQE